MPDLSYTPSQVVLRFANAMLAISLTDSTICRRAKWGDTPIHVFAQVDSDNQMQFILMDESGALSIYDPTPEDILSADWQVISLLH